MISKNQKLLVVVESPTKVHTVTKILKELGYEKVTVMASIGHTTRIKDKKNSYNNTGIYPAEDFRVEWEVDPDKFEVIERLKAQARQSDLVLIASDPDREGESLGNHIKNLLNLADNQYYRIKYHSITKEALQKALENPEKMDEALCDAAESRQLVDKMIGYTLSPVAKTYVGARSVGRCQSAGLKLVADREKEIQNFVPEHYYDLYLYFVKNNTEFKAKYVGTSTRKIDKITSTDDLAIIKNRCKDPYTILEVETLTKKENPKPPFCTATFQQEAANKLNLKIKDAMSCAQKLFEAGYCTYMRTDSTDLAKDFLPGLKKYIEQNYGPKMYCKPRTGQKSKNAQEGHEALRVADPMLTPEILTKALKNDLLVKVYKLIWQRTIAAAMPEAEISETTYTIQSNEHLFKLTSRELMAPGYRIVYGTPTPEEELMKVCFERDEVLENTRLQEQAKQTQPPSRYKEATLVKELQQQEIGRPSTYAMIVETLLSPTRGYCELIDKQLVPTDRGLQLASFLDRSFSDIINLDYTRQLEEYLDTIATKNLSKLDFLKDFYRKLENSISNNAETAGNALQLDSKTCPQCGELMVIRRSRYGKLFYGCSQYPACRGVIGIK